MLTRTSLLAIAFVVVALPAGLGASSPTEPGAAPMILSAVVDGHDLVIRGERLLAETGAPPFVTLSGQILQVRPGFAEHQLRVGLPRVRPGTYLLTVASGPGAPAAGVMPVTLTPAAAVEDGPAAIDGAVHVCANRRHTRVVDDPADCKQNERAFSLAGSTDDSEPPADGEDGEDGEDDGEEGEDGREEGDSLEGDEEDDGSNKCKNKGKGKGKKKKCD